ncbi:EAL domain-containing response regulator [Xanthobacter tagetidis]|jgi:EAL domain-containing protein (putative c-di-GMP-specific phosphodiesterase class I)/FixJ family two-component response regulator|uniref:EAL domain-containing protein n=1 Tax=Xanthobacter tagetidis TaxID=60216 RepID=A0A3L7ALR5_9HYPH|nr:EAL domain-containing response regulator [Xanthobacter tagetidis]MBB6309181.1 EAL domain-containing protein (putative c-di-GMP-specific phosphodiesterase class I)/FixJ family two-component response regulator [Xanthobacter tagetidis]RLP80342.1 EAL domain-containing protein [Xanthobacter tagetidis]
MPEQNIFVLDDERDIGEYVCTVAKMNGFESHYFSNPNEFFAALAASPTACVAIDLQMPILDGIEVMRRLSAMQFHRPILIMSGMDLKVLESARHFAKAHRLAVSDIISKPVRVEEMNRIFGRLKSSSHLPPSKADLIEAMERGEFVLYLQPKARIRNEPGGHSRYTPLGFEGLARWNSPTRGLSVPDVFIPQIIASGLSPQFSDLVFDLALATLKRWGPSAITASLAINMSASDVEDITLADRLWSRCLGSGVDHQRITIEITESAAMEHPERALDVLTRLRLRGFSLSLDDFGTGYSSLVQLQRLPFAELKIDRSLTADCMSSEHTRIIVKAIIDLGHNLGLAVVAEGVEDQETLELLSNWSCDHVQGYLLAQPLPPDLAEKWWHEKHGSAHP